MLLYFLCVPKYRNIKLGKDTDEPEFSYLQWFSMVFAAGVAVGLFFFGVAEPMWHFHGTGRRPAAAATFERVSAGKTTNHRDRRAP